MTLRSAHEWEAAIEDAGDAFPEIADDEYATPEQLQRAVRHALEQHNLEQLPPQYAACVEQVLAADERLLTGWELARLGALVEQTLGAYAHLATGPDRPPFVATHLQDLYRVKELVGEAQQAWNESREPVELPVKKKLRAHLRAALDLIARP